MQLKFLYGQNLKDKNDVVFRPGTIYLDTATGELFFDNPSTQNEQVHNKIIDTATLIYQIDSNVIFPSAGSEDEALPGVGDLTGSATAVLGKAILGTMKLGTQ